MVCHGCGRPTTVDVEDTTPPFSFRALDLQQRSSDGKKAWSLTSPEARYDLRSSVARALRPEGVIFDKGQPLYKLVASTGTVINDGAVILLEGDIQLKRLGKDPLLLSADRALWIPREALMRFDLSPQVRNLQTRISARTATLHLDRDLLKLQGEPKVERWSRPVPLNVKRSEQAPEILGILKEIQWNPGKGDLKGEGPVTITRRPPDRAVARRAQVLRASRLEANTLKQEYTLFPPVQLEDPSENSWFRGGEFTIDTKDQWLKSKAPFQAQMGELQLEGEQLRLDAKRTLATIGNNCRLLQGGDALQAQQCQWNWTTQAVEAGGNVLYQRAASRQLTRAQRIEGSLGPKGSLKATAPDGKVFSQLQVPRRAGPGKKPAEARPKPEPIVF